MLFEIKTQNDRN